MSAMVTIDTDVVAVLLACWIAAGGVALVGVLWVHRQWRRRMRERRAARQWMP